MIFRARLSLTSLESRENPSTPTVDPIGGIDPAPTDPVVTAPADPAPADPTTTAVDAAAAGATLPDATSTDPLLGNNTIYNVPLLP
ncbi:MAG: hypothetical protein J0I06_28200 [Planctomycetes bacterium]|nr:hypothetical protein [Planctomycetota bacterium]